MIVTFYSFKGGVGRSMAMAAVGYLLAQRGMKVLVIDFDLEAPGLERYFFDEPSSLATVRSNQGLIDFVLAYKRALTSAEEFKRAEFKDWSRYIVDAIPRTPSGGSVDLMTAGCRHPQDRYADYALFVRTFAWQDFFQNWRGDRFFDWLRRELTAGPNGYDVVLVDSRTGVTEMGGVCAYQLADAAVLFCAPNYQNLDGTRAVLDDFRSHAVTALRSGRPLEIVVVPARVEPSDTAKRDQFFADLERTFGSDGLPKILADAGLDYQRLAVPYDRELAIIERLVDETTIHDGPLAAHSAARAAFERLADVVLLLGGANGPQWETRRREAFARLRAGGETPGSLPIADLSKRGSGYDAFVYAGPEDDRDAANVTGALTAANLSAWSVSDIPSDKGQIDALIGRVLQYSDVVLVGIGRSRPNDFLWTLLRRTRERRKPVVPVALPGCPDVAAALQQYGFAPDSAVDGRELATNPRSLERLTDAVSHRDGAAAKAEPAVDPYPGAPAFSEDQAPYFYGRETDADRLLSAVLENHIVLLSGAASIGKSSLVHAGLLPQLRARGGAGSTPEQPWSVVVANMTGGEADAALEQAASASGTRALLIVIDGIDETGDDVKEEVRERRLARITEIVGAADAERRFLLVWRGTWPAEERKRAREAWFDRRQSCEVTLDPMDAAGVRAAIEKPAAQAGHLFEPGLVDRIIQDAGTQPGAIAQIQRTLKELWAGRRRGWLTNRTYDTGNGLAGRFGDRLQKCLDTLDAGSRGAAEVLLRALVEFDSRLGVVPVHRSWTSMASIPLMQQQDRIALRERLVQERIIDLWMTDASQLSSVAGADRGWTCALAQPTVPVIVAALAQADPRFLLWRQRFGSYVYGYLQSGRPESYTVPSDALKEAEEWSTARRDELTADEQAVIASSMRADAAAAAMARWRRRISVVTLMVIVVILAGIIYQTRRNREVERLQLAGESFHRAAEQAESSDVGPTLAFLGQTLRLNPDHAPARSLTLAVVLSMAWPRQTIPTTGVLEELTWSGDDGQLLGASTNGIWLWDAATGAARAELRRGEGIAAAAWSPDGNRFVSGTSESGLQLWDASTREPVGEPLKHEAAITVLAWSPDSQLLATGSEDWSVRVWDARSGASRARLMHPDMVTAMAWAPLGDRIATASLDGRVRMWRLPTADSITLPDVPAPVRALAWTRDGSLAAVCADGMAVVWRPGSGTPIEYSQPGGPVLSVDWNAATNMFATGLRGGTVYLWQPDRQPEPLQWHAASGLSASAPSPDQEPAVTTLAWSPSGVLLAAASGNAVRVFQTRTWQPVGDVLRHQSDVTALAWTRSGRRLATADADAARVWDVGVTRPAATVLMHNGNAVDAAWNPTRPRAISGSFDGTARVWDTNTGAEIAVLPHDTSVVSVAWSLDGSRAMTSSADGLVRVWDMDRKDPLVTKLAHGAPLTVVAWSRDQQRVATAGEDSIVRVWRVSQPGAPLAVLTHAAVVGALAWNPDGTRLATGSEDRIARVWDTSGDNPQPVAQLSGDGSITALAWQSDGSRLAIGTSGRMVHVWTAARDGQDLRLEHGGETRALAWSPTGGWLATASADGQARVWNVERGKLMGSPMSHGAAVWDVHWSPDGRRLATAAWDSTARVWDPFTGLAASLPLLHRGNVLVSHWSADGDRLLTASSDHMVRIWDVPDGASSDAERLADVAEVVGGLRIDFEQGPNASVKIPTLVPADTLPRRIQRIRTYVTQARNPSGSSFDRLLAWFLSDPNSTTISPLSTANVVEYVKRLQASSNDGLDELYTSFPAFGQ